MATVGAVLAAVLTGINIGLAVRTFLRERRASRQEPPVHPLDNRLRDIALAIRGLRLP